MTQAPAHGHDHPLARWHAMVRDHDPSGPATLLAEDAVFFSPVVHTPQRGKAITQAYLTAAFHVFFNPTFKYVREVVGPTDAVLEFETEIDGVHVNGVDMLRWDGSGLLTEFKVMLRPLKAVQMVHARMAAQLTRAAGPA